MIYRWRSNTHFKVDPQAVGEHLEHLRATHGLFTAATVLADASFEGSPLHPCFEWDDTKAAEAWRLRVAGQLIGAVVVMTGPSAEDSAPIRAFVCVQQDDVKSPGSFTSTKVAQSDEVFRARMVERAITELRQWRSRYDFMHELADFCVALDLVFDARAPKKADPLEEGASFRCEVCGGKATTREGHPACNKKAVAA